MINHRRDGEAVVRHKLMIKEVIIDLTMTDGNQNHNISSNISHNCNKLPLNAKFKFKMITEESVSLISLESIIISLMHLLSSYPLRISAIPLVHFTFDCIHPYHSRRSLKASLLTYSTKFEFYFCRYLEAQFRNEEGRTCS